jgi:hypothetical protein
MQIVIYSQVNIYFSLYYLLILRAFDLTNLLTNAGAFTMISDILHLLYYLEGFVNMIAFMIIFR